MSLMKRNLFLPILCLIHLFYGCNANNDTLTEVERIIDEHPDSALYLLDYVDPSDLSSRQLAKYALLYTKAQYKNYIDAPNDSLISIAVDYYETHGSNEEKFYAYLYHGCILYELADYDKASQAFFLAVSCADEIDDYFHLGHLYNNMSYLMLEKHCSDEAETYARLSYQNYIKAEKEDYAISALVTLASSKSSNSQRDSCQIFAEDALSRARLVKDTTSIIDALMILELNAVLSDSINKALSIIDELNSIDSYKQTSGEFAILSYIHTFTNSKDSIDKYIRLSLETAQTSSDSTFCYAFASKSFEKIKELELAFAYQDTMLHFEKNLLVEGLKHTTIAAQRDYIESKLTQSEYVNRQKNFVICNLIAIFCCLLFIAFLLYNKKKNTTELQAEKIKNLQLEISKITDEQRAKLNQLCNHEIVANMHAYATSSQLMTEAEWAKLNSLFDNFYPIFGEQLKTLHILSEIEWRVCMLIKLGFNPSEIAELTNKSLNGISSIRSRLFEKVFKKKGKSTEWDKFINSL